MGAALLALTGANLSAAVSWNEIQLSGFLSQGYVQSSANDYLGLDTSDGDFDLREYGLSANYRFVGQWRVGAQVFGQELGRFGNDDISLDWAIADYNVSQAFGLRAGRVKLPRGLYNEALDLDAARVWALLPQSTYDARLRDFQASFDGGMAYGSIEAGKVGSFDYKVFYGERSIAPDAGVSDFFNDDAQLPYTNMGMGSIWGGTVFWNHPELALRVGYTFNRLDTLYGVQDMSAVAFPGAYVKVIIPGGYDRHMLSAEYISGDWTFAAEVAIDHGDIYLENNVGAPNGPAGDIETKYGYLSLARRINDQWEVGSYYSFSQGDSTTPDIKNHQDDLALSVRFNARANLVLKLEAHFVDGTSLISNPPLAPQPNEARDGTWNYFVGKATVFF